LECHSKPDVAPKSLVKLYGTTNGFNWKLNEIVGIQIVSVPASKVFQNAHRAFFSIMGLIIVIFGFTIYMVNLCLKQYVVKPITQMARVAEAISMGDMKADFNKVADDEVGQLAEAFNRMKMSLMMAMQRLERIRKGS